MFNDFLIVGLGAMGSAAAHHLAQRGAKVLGLDRFTPPHTLGSSHGQTRIIREAYFEHPDYVPLIQRAYELWDTLAHAVGEELLRRTGGLMIGPPDGVVVSGARRSVEAHHLPHEVLTAGDVRRRYPGLRPDNDMLAVFEPRAGILFPERCVAANLRLAAGHGATLRFDEQVLHWSPDGDGVCVVTALGKYRARQLVLTAGSWINSLLPDLNLPFTVERQVQFWFGAARTPDVFHPDRCPVHLWQYDGDRFFYGFPDLGNGVKVACHHRGEPADPNAEDREVSPEEIEGMQGILRRFLPAAADSLREAVVCKYTMTPDEHFWIDRHPAYPQVLIVSPCSGHGFKFSAVIGEVVADLLMSGRSRFDLSLFRHRPGTQLHSVRLDRTAHNPPLNHQRNSSNIIPMTPQGDPLS
ncbi:MAG: N-methyl-L-tryptophan oxidase [Pedosphaera sp.]|nr:N-methyl-L-tryptophan oxidase [Pedosphaera sp.]